MKSKLIKGLALFSFITLISAFLLYSGGYFDRKMEKLDDSPPPVWSLPVQENSTASFNSTEFDVDTLLPEMRFPSTKSTMIPLDRLILRRKRGLLHDTAVLEKELRMMSSSKSGRIFDASTFNIDSAIKKLDLQKIEKKKQE